MKNSEILEVIRNQGIKRGGLQATRTLAESAGDVDVKTALPAIRALLIIMEQAEAESSH